jgi:hypothetical protein
VGGPSDRTAIADAALRSRKRNPGARPGEARELAELPASRSAPRGDEAVEFGYGSSEDTPWRSEVADVRMVAWSEAAEAWCAIGTLRSEGARPGAASYWQGR